MVDQEMLQAISQLMDSKLGVMRTEIDGKLGTMQNQMDRMQTQIDSGFSNVDSKFDAMQAQMDSKFSAVDSRFDTMQADLSSLKKDVARINHTLEPKINLILEGIEGLQERNVKMDKMERTLEEHDNRIFALEQID